MSKKLHSLCRWSVFCSILCFCACSDSPYGIRRNGNQLTVSQADGESHAHYSMQGRETIQARVLEAKKSAPGLASWLGLYPNFYKLTGTYGQLEVMSEQGYREFEKIQREQGGCASNGVLAQELRIFLLVANESEHLAETFANIGRGSSVALTGERLTLLKIESAGQEIGVGVNGTQLFLLHDLQLH